MLPLLGSRRVPTPRHRRTGPCSQMPRHLCKMRRPVRESLRRLSFQMRRRALPTSLSQIRRRACKERRRRLCQIQRRARRMRWEKRQPWGRAYADEGTTTREPPRTLCEAVVLWTVSLQLLVNGFHPVRRRRPPQLRRRKVATPRNRARCDLSDKQGESCRGSPASQRGR